MIKRKNALGQGARRQRKMIHKKRRKTARKKALQCQTKDKRKLIYDQYEKEGNLHVTHKYFIYACGN